MTSLRTKERAAAPNDRAIMAALALLLAAIYLFSARFRFYTIDEVATFATTRSLAQHGQYDADILAWALPISGANSVVATGLDGHLYSIKDVAPSLLMVPLAALAYGAGISAVRAVYILPVIVTALSGALLYRMVRDQGYRQVVALLAALAYGLGTMAFPYAKTLFTQPETALGLLIALWGVASARRTRARLPALIGGLGLGLAGLSSTPVLATLPIYPVALVRRPARGVGSWVASLREAAPCLIYFALGAGLLMGTQGLFNLARFGSPLATGHTEVGASLGWTYFGLGSWGQLISAPRGVMWYVPLLWLIPFSLAAAHRGRDPLWLLSLCMAQSVIVWAVYSSYFYWWGGSGFGPRFLVPVMPALTLLTVPVLDRALAAGAHLWQRVAVGSILLVSVATQTAASITGDRVSDLSIGAILDPLTPPRSFFTSSPALVDPANLPQPQLLLSMLPPGWDTLWATSGRPDALLIVLELALIAAAALLLAATIQKANSRLYALGLGLHAAAIVGVVAFALGRYPRTPGYYLAEAPPPDAGIEAAHQWLHSHARPGDGVIVLLYPEQMLSWMESPVAVPPDIGLTLENPLRPQTRGLLSHVGSWHPRLWVVSRGSFSGDPANGIERWLAARTYIGASVSAEDMRLTPYLSTGTPQPLREQGVVFGAGVIELTDASVTSLPDGVAVWLRWKALRAPGENYTAFVHVLDAGGNLIGQHDGWPVGGYVPTSGWQPSQVIDDRHAVLLPDSLPAGDYRIQVGFYATASREPLAVSGSGNRAALIATLHLGR